MSDHSSSAHMLHPLCMLSAIKTKRQCLLLMRGMLLPTYSYDAGAPRVHKLRLSYAVHAPSGLSEYARMCIWSRAGDIKWGPGAPVFLR